MLLLFVWLWQVHLIYVAVFLVTRENTFYIISYRVWFVVFCTKFSQAIGCEKLELLSIVLGETAWVRAVSYMGARCNYTEITASGCGVWHFVFRLMCGRVRITWAVNNGDEAVCEMMEYELLSLFWLIVQEDLILFDCYRTCKIN